MPFNDEQLKLITDRLKERVRSNCPLCASKVVLAPDLYVLQEYSPLGLSVGGGQPCITLVCSNCGNVLLFNVFALGLGEKLGLTPRKETE